MIQEADKVERSLRRSPDDGLAERQQRLWRKVTPRLTSFRQIILPAPAVCHLDAKAEITIGKSLIARRAAFHSELLFPNGGVSIIWSPTNLSRLASTCDLRPSALTSAHLTLPGYPSNS